MPTDTITFSFGKNWKDFLSTVDESVIAEAGRDIDDWLPREIIQGKTVIDVGSGSGLHSLCLHRRGCRQLLSFDFDPHSVEATGTLARREGNASNWKILEGSILDERFVASLGRFDVVYSWGVLHHTGAMWTAVDHATRLCAPGGLFLIALYAGGDLYGEHLAAKRAFNSASDEVKDQMVRKLLALSAPSNGASSPDDLTRRERGMTLYHDAVDWLGGLPYEVSHVSETLLFAAARGLHPIRVLQREQGGCSVYLFRRCEASLDLLQSTFEWRATWSDKADTRTIQRQLEIDLSSASRAMAAQREELAWRRRQMASVSGTARRLLHNVRTRLFAGPEPHGEP